MLSLMAAWVSKIIKDNGKLKDIVSLYLFKTGLDLTHMLKTNFKNLSERKANTFSQFYQDVFTAYNRCKVIKPLAELKHGDIMSQVIWGNENLLMIRICQ